ncbi:MAG: GntR family transcriptional regulator [Ancalomicrobiaceae bacterium]|nr:GntR family transcriptional regulator [Ancalomicrobiaceae bacterium]
MTLAHPTGSLTIERRSLYDPVADQLRDMIVRGELQGGDKIRMAELAETLGVSITPLREALKVLAEEQLIELLPNRGARVLPYTAADADQLFDVIASLEGLAAELAAERMPNNALADLETMHAEMRGQFEATAREPYFALNSAIHADIVRLSGNDVLIATHRRLMVRANRGRYMAIVDNTRWREAMDEHERLMQALSRRDAEAAGRLWRTHMRNTGAAVRLALVRAAPSEIG